MASAQCRYSGYEGATENEIPEKSISERAARGSVPNPSKTRNRKVNMETTDKISLHYEVRGVGAPLILIHGLALSSEIWKPQIDRLCKYFRIVTYDLRGHGKSDKPEDESAYSGERFVQDLLDLYRHLHFQRGMGSSLDN